MKIHHDLFNENCERFGYGEILDTQALFTNFTKL